MSESALHILTSNSSVEKRRVKYGTVQYVRYLRVPSGSSIRVRIFIRGGGREHLKGRVSIMGEKGRREGWLKRVGGWDRGSAI